MPKLTLEQLQGRPEFLFLTVRQRKAVLSFLETGDRLKAVEAAYSCKTPESARVMVYAVFGNFHIIACLAVANGLDPEKAVFEAKLERLSRSKKVSAAQVAVLNLLGLSKGWLREGTEPEPAVQSQLEVGPCKPKSKSKSGKPDDSTPQNLNDLYEL
jgi:hypothetical protein